MEEVPGEWLRHVADLRSLCVRLEDGNRVSLHPGQLEEVSKFCSGRPFDRNWLILVPCDGAETEGQMGSGVFFMTRTGSMLPVIVQEDHAGDGLGQPRPAAPPPPPPPPAQPALSRQSSRQRAEAQMVQRQQARHGGGGRVPPTHPITYLESCLICAEDDDTAGDRLVSFTPGACDHETCTVCAARQVREALGDTSQCFPEGAQCLFHGSGCPAFITTSDTIQLGRAHAPPSVGNSAELLSDEEVCISPSLPHAPHHTSRPFMGVLLFAHSLMRSAPTAHPLSTLMPRGRYCASTVASPQSACRPTRLSSARGARHPKPSAAFRGPPHSDAFPP